MTAGPATDRLHEVLGRAAFAASGSGSIESGIMYRKLVLFVVAIWALQVLPALCIAGVLTHACAPHKSAPHDSGPHESGPPAHPCHDEKENGCEHESDCSQDPCSNLTVRHERDDSIDQLDLTLLAALPNAVIARSFEDPHKLPNYHGPKSPPLLDLSCPESLLPLLI
jgi:hypothetical protein